AAVRELARDLPVARREVGARRYVARREARGGGVPALEVVAEERRREAVGAERRRALREERFEAALQGRSAQLHRVDRRRAPVAVGPRQDLPPPPPRPHVPDPPP